MGCLFTKLGWFRTHHELREETPKQYSWDKKREVDMKNIMVDGVKNETVGRIPQQINGQQFVIQNCENCNIYVFDHINTVTVDDCINCNIFLGPIKTSIFIRDCKECRFVLACQQFRTRDCQKIDVFLCCGTQPIIEASSGMKFACYQYYYPELEDQFKQAGLSVFNNTWSNIHDFSQDPTEAHFSLLPEDAKVEEYVPDPTNELFVNVHIDHMTSKSVVPLTHGTRRKISDESCLIVFFHDDDSQSKVWQFIKNMREAHPELILIQTKEVTMQPPDASRVFRTDTYASAVSLGPVIGLEYNGDNSVQCCQEVLARTGPAQNTFISQSRDVAAGQVENFYNFADMQMAV
ncbi:hypothetical protein CHS0354_005049 [Potamilus streckersoni]|uniref:Protein XRP2 n=1 Tax=Potamilus streckersoni TaxID=2493646 RepID=A0AAE0SHM0_9BIVA|nr:hypothetical protein CHS0354_005049 [Potamilus streckersoni]